jgi:benzoyl-CoA reductase/2-hydroxyglutaryl-CoA dehydratase subunit BcrC/BadD/HgdB
MGTLSLGANYLKEEFNKLKIALEKHASITISDNDIKNAIKVFKESRLIYNQLNSLRIENPPSITATDLMNITTDFFKSEPEIWNDKTQSILENITMNAPKRAINNNPRILLSGSPLHEIDFIAFIEEIGLNVVYEDLCTGSKFFDLVINDSHDLLASLSEAYLNRTPCARMMQIKERVDQIYNTAEKFKVDGVIYHSLKFCDTCLYDVPALKKMLTEKGLNVLFIESDGGLGNNNQIRTRIEAFSEIIKS